VRAKAEDSWASLEPHFDSQHRPTGSGILCLCIPVEGKRHDSLQVVVSDSVIVGGWQDRHYAWDDDRQEAFRSQVVNGAEDVAIAEVLRWLEGELGRLH
jgi:hypothetical protein